MMKYKKSTLISEGQIAQQILVNKEYFSGIAFNLDIIYIYKFYMEKRLIL